jgi:hypothetical protein
LVGSFEVVSEDPEVMAKLLAIALSLVSGYGFEACCVSVDSCMVVNVPISASVTVGLGQTPEQMTIPTTHMPITIQVSVSKAIDLDKGMLDEAVKLMDKLKDALRDSSTSKRAEELLRVIRWWALGDLDTDPVDRFLKFFIAFEMLASLEGYKGKFGDLWVEKFCVDYGLTCEFEGKRVNKIRNLIMHEPGEDRERAEEVARKHADEFGREVLKAIWRVLSEELKISI